VGELNASIGKILPFTRRSPEKSAPSPEPRPTNEWGSSRAADPMLAAATLSENSGPRSVVIDATHLFGLNAHSIARLTDLNTRNMRFRDPAYDQQIKEDTQFLYSVIDTPLRVFHQWARVNSDKVVELLGSDYAKITPRGMHVCEELTKNLLRETKKLIDDRDKSTNVTMSAYVIKNQEIGCRWTNFKALLTAEGYVRYLPFVAEVCREAGWTGERYHRSSLCDALKEILKT
jgi:hypothetical protein